MALFSTKFDTKETVCFTLTILQTFLARDTMADIHSLSDQFL